VRWKLEVKVHFVQCLNRSEEEDRYSIIARSLLGVGHFEKRARFAGNGARSGTYLVWGAWGLSGTTSIETASEIPYSSPWVSRRHWTRCARIHRIAFWLCSGQWKKAGRNFHSCGMNLWSMRSMTPIMYLLQFHTIVPSPHSVILVWTESECAHFVQALVSVSRMAAKRSLVCIMSCSAAYHMDFYVTKNAGV